MVESSPVCVRAIRHCQVTLWRWFQVDPWCRLCR